MSALKTYRVWIRAAHPEAEPLDMAGYVDSVVSRDQRKVLDLVLQDPKHLEALGPLLREHGRCFILIAASVNADAFVAPLLIHAFEIELRSSGEG